MRTLRLWCAVSAVAILLVAVLPMAAYAQSPAPAGGDAPVYIPVVSGGAAVQEPVTPPAVEEPVPIEPPPTSEVPPPTEPAPPPTTEPPLPPKVVEPEVAAPEIADSADAAFWDSNNPVWDDPDLVKAAGTTAPDWNIVGDFTVSHGLGVGQDPPNYVGDFRRNTNGHVQLRVTNYSIHNAGAVSLAAAGSAGAAVFKVFGQGFIGTWSGIPMARYAAIQADTSLYGMVVATNGADPLILGTNSAERLRIVANGYVGIGTTSPGSKLTVDNPGSINVLHLKGPGVNDSQARLTFGDGSYVYINEPVDDNLEIHGANEINLTTARVEVNGDRPVRIMRIENVNNNFNTGISAATYSCVATSWSARYDIDENETDNNSIWMYTAGGTWWVVAQLNSHIDFDNPDVDVLCFRNEMVNYTGNKALWDPD